MIQVAHMEDESPPPLHHQQQQNHYSSQQQLRAAHQIIKLSHSNHMKTLPQPAPHETSSFFKKFSTKFLIVFAICAVLTIVICSILIAVMTVQFFINSKMYDKYKDNMRYANPNIARETNQDNNANESNTNNNKTERNSFNSWIQNSFGQKIFGLNMDNFYQTKNYPGTLYP